MKFLDIFKRKVQTVPIVEFNNLKQELEEANARVLSLTKEKEDIINKNEIAIAESEYTESQTRTKQIESILSKTNITGQEQKKLLQTLVNSDLTVDFIAETYAPISYKKNNFETKLPQKSIADRSKDLSYYR